MLNFLLILVVIFAFIACGDDSADEIVGSWELAGENSAFRPRVIFTFENSGKLTVSSYNDVATYDVSGNILTTNFSLFFLQHYREEDNQSFTLTFSDNGNVVRFDEVGGDDFLVFRRLNPR